MKVSGHTIAVASALSAIDKKSENTVAYRNTDPGMTEQ